MDDPQPLVLCHRQPAPAPAGLPELALTAAERRQLRGRRHSRCGLPLLLQLPRGEPLRPGDGLAATAEGPPLVRVVAAAEDLLRLRTADALALVQAAYHLGNRHVALQILPGELRLLADPVLERLLRDRGLAPEALRAPFDPEAGAYDDHGGGHHHDHGHPHDH
ncbi:MAG: urease accessory protein UreE [Cyanobacteriota bacterium]